MSKPYPDILYVNHDPDGDFYTAAAEEEDLVWAKTVATYALVDIEKPEFPATEGLNPKGPKHF